MNRREVRQDWRARMAAAEAAVGVGKAAASFCVSCGSPMRINYDRSGRTVACSNDECPYSRHPHHEEYFPGLRLA